MKALQAFRISHVQHALSSHFCFQAWCGEIPTTLLSVFCKMIKKILYEACFFLHHFC